ncbi:MAG TPA: type IV toxin-antitoxin system AbiEi family antitoxin domain-containing protein [Solirubrobacteraceae bacterium]|nr:type IV toxin-antitoxin system AbiEi family antitoxin domain-containing protein [Solirubrobacteraceae bacterium]
MIALAVRQQGVVAAWQLLGLGFSREAIKHGVRSGWLIPVHRGVYAVGRPLGTWRGHAMAAVLACGPHALLSHRSAGALWEITRRVDGPFCVIAPNNHGRPGIVVRRSTTMRPRDAARRWNIPVTSVPRTLIDLADVLDDRQLERAVGQAYVQRFITARELAAALEGICNRRARRRLMRFIKEPAPSRSALEDAFLRFCRRDGLPLPLMNVYVQDIEVDAFWPAARVIVELDGYAFHGDRVAFERDRERRAELASHGYVIYVITWRRLRDQPALEAERLGRLLAR